MSEKMMGICYGITFVMMVLMSLQSYMLINRMRTTHRRLLELKEHYEMLILMSEDRRGETEKSQLN